MESLVINFLFHLSILVIFGIYLMKNNGKLKKQLEITQDIIFLSTCLISCVFLYSYSWGMKEKVQLANVFTDFITWKHLKKTM